jgi:hypothetical protein
MVKVKTYGINYIFWNSLPNYLAALFVSFGSLDELLIPIDPLFQLHYDFKLGKACWNAQHEEIFMPCSYSCLFTETHWGKLENIFKKY